jgi:hypothetical protein
MQHWLFIALRSVLMGWATLCLIVFVVERPLLHWTAPVIGAEWIATVKLGLDCAGLAATGWVVGRLARPEAMLGVLSFLATLTVWDLTVMVGINVPWLLRLLIHTLSGDGNYLSSLLATAASQTILFGSLLAGGMLSRPTAKPVSITGNV